MVWFVEVRQKLFGNAVAVVTVVRLLIGLVAARLNVSVPSMGRKYFTRKKRAVNERRGKRERSLAPDIREAARLTNRVLRKT
jgi:hypothetical protein